MSGQVNPDELALYDLIWKRTVASQMADAKIATTTLRLGATATDGVATIFSASGTVVTFPGFPRVRGESRDDDDSGEQRRLPRLSQGDEVTIRALTAEGTLDKAACALGRRGDTAPRPSRSGASAVRRPGQHHRDPAGPGYVFKRGTALVTPAWLAFAVVALLRTTSAYCVDYDFTAELEGILDTIAGVNNRATSCRAFYYGGANRAVGGSGFTR